ncbi:hypothetical protein Bca4012_060628 [Brassica carinata]|uniref:Uncharacterized protein n=1 Tax=Brassica carinata TaxID=52824 RepID=A0A8X7SA51_BRACI|nr:hypothetical protein Bca52824_030964 [Brassica carinata]
MAPCLKSVYNVSGKSVHVNIDGRSFDIDHDESQPIDRDISSEGYTKINKVNSEDIQGYRLRYHNYNILLNDALGKSKDVADYAVHTEYYDQDVRIQIFPDEMHLSCNGKYLGIHIVGGGTSVHGGEKNLAEDGHVKGKTDEVEEASATTKGPNAKYLQD